MSLRLPRLKLHNKILLALILGAVFGSLASVSKYALLVTFQDTTTRELRTDTVEGWDEVEMVFPGVRQDTLRFGAENQSRILGEFGRFTSRERDALILWVRTSRPDAEGTALRTSRKFERVSAIEKVPTIATMIKPVGTIFIRLLMFVAIPLVVSSLIVGASSLGDLRRVGRIGAKTLAFYAVTIVSAITIGLVLVNFVQPGTRLSADSRERLMMEFRPGVESRIQQEATLDLRDTVIRIVATNPFDALARGDMLQIVFFSLMVGVSLTAVAREKAAHVISFFDGFSDLMIRMVDMIMTIAPYGVFALIAATVAEFGFDILGTLGWYAATVLVGLLIHQFVVLGTIVRVLGGLNPVTFFKGIRQVMLVGFSSSSSAATLPVNMEACEKNLGVPKEITSFVLPLGATVNMDGTSMYQAIATVFIAQVYGVDLSLGAQLTILLMAVLASIGTAPVPGVGIVMLIIVLRSVHVPEEGIALIMGIDRFLDMCRTVPNVTGDAVVSVIMARQEGVLRKPILEAA